jgi:hypothetical protein
MLNIANIFHVGMSDDGTGVLTVYRGSVCVWWFERDNERQAGKHSGGNRCKPFGGCHPSPVPANGNLTNQVDQRAGQTGERLVEMTTTYRAIASRGERFWLVRVHGLGATDDGLPTQARTLADVEPWARDLIATYLDLEPDSFAVDVEIELPERVQAHLHNANELRGRAAKAQSESADEYRAAARGLKALGLTVRDIGAALNVSHQRAQQLLADREPANC